MKKNLLIFLVAFATAVGVKAQIQYEWGTATWNIVEGAVFEDLDDFNSMGVKLTYPNPAGYALTPMNMISVAYKLYVDDNEARDLNATGRTEMGATTISVSFNGDIIEGHSYKIVTENAVLVGFNPAKMGMDSLSVNTDSYTISFSVKGPELVKTIDVEATMSLAIEDQEEFPTTSAIDVDDICESLGISTIASAKIYGLNLNGTYNDKFGVDWYDGWHAEDGSFTVYWGGYDSVAGRNAPFATYSIKFNDEFDALYYYYYDHWDEYNPETPDSIDGSGMSTKARKANQKINWDWVSDEGEVYKYTRTYRCVEGTDYKASFAFLANKKMVLVNATLHFVSVDDFTTPIAQTKNEDAEVVAIFNASGVRQNGLVNGVNIVKYSNGMVKKILK